MKSFSLLILAFSFSIFTKAQNAYIQVSGESGLSVFLDSQFKGKTTAELGGYIIENVKPGSHLIKVVKDGYTPFEETISVKPGEVFSYKVKPFQKNVVTISEKGNAGETQKTVEVSKGKLIVQSVPIEVKITMPQIEGVNNMTKTKDQWIVDDIAAGRYTITFTFNNKTITKNIEITGDHETSVFVNMLNGSFTSKSDLTAEQKAANEKENARLYVATLVERFRFQPNLTPDQFISQCPAAARVLSYREGTQTSTYSIPFKTLKKQQGLLPGYTHIEVQISPNWTTYRKVIWVDYTFVVTKDYAKAKAEYDKIMNEFKENVKGSYSYDDSYAPGGILRYRILRTLMGVDYEISLSPNDEGWYIVELKMRHDGDLIRR